MALLKMRTPVEREWEKLLKQEEKYAISRFEKKESKLDQFLEEKVPPKLQETLDGAFAKAFEVIFEKGTGVIEKTYNKENLETQYDINRFSDDVSGTRKTLKSFSKNAKKSGRFNMAFSSASGIGLGFLGIGLPDIVLFTGTLLKSVYEIALNYGYNYELESEKKFILDIITGATKYGEEFKMMNHLVNLDIEEGVVDNDELISDKIKLAAKGLSGELLYMKFLQGIPVVGAVGGIYNGVYIKNITKYAELKYRRRFYYEKLTRENHKSK